MELRIMLGPTHKSLVFVHRTTRLASFTLCALLLFTTNASAQATPDTAVSRHGQGYATLTLDQARETLRENSYQIRLAESQVGEAEIYVDQARALLLPRVEASANYTFNGRQVEFELPNVYEPILPFLDVVRTDVAPNNPDLFDPSVLVQPTEAAIIVPRHDVRGSVTVTQSIYNARAFPLLRQAYLTIDQARSGIDQTAYQLEGALIQAYFAACTLRQFIEINERNLELVTIAAERAQIAHEEGIGNLFELNRALVDVAAAERDLQNARTSYLIAVETVAMLINREPDFDVETPQIRPVDLDVDLAGLDGRRPDLQAIQLQIDVAEEQIREREVEWFPTVGAQLTGNIQRRTAFGGDVFAWSASIFANWMIYDGGVRRAELRRREYDIVHAEMRREELVASITSDARRAQLQIEQGRANVALAERQVELANANVMITRDALEAGAATSLDLQIAQQQAFLSELALADASIGLQQTLYEFAHLLASDRRPPPPLNP